MLSTVYCVKHICAFAVMTIEFLFGLLSDFSRTPFGLRVHLLQHAVARAWRQEYGRRCSEDIQPIFTLFFRRFLTPFGLRARPLHNAVRCAWCQE